VLINITGGYDLTLFELDEAANRIREEVDPEANIIVGSTLDPAMEGLMRVSVVATGIDVAPATTEVPVPRRPLAEPLHRSAAAPAEAAPVPPAAAVTAPAYRARPDEGPLFDRAAPEMEPEALLDAEAEADTGAALPPPAYRPQQPVPPVQRELHVEDDAGAFVAPRPRAPGTPSPEALARLQAAVSKAPGAGRAAATAPMAASRPGQPAPAAEKPRFSVNSLINRMTGSGAEHHERQATLSRGQTPVQSAYDDEPEADPEQDRIEIPAFLRRQAN